MPEFSLSKKTKAELLEEYQKVLSQFEELKMAAKLTHQPDSMDTVSKARGLTIEAANQSISEAKSAVSNTLSDAANKLGGVLASLHNDIATEMNKFNDLERAIEISKKNLELRYHIQVAAETLENLVTEHETKLKEFEREEAARRAQQEAEAAAARRDWAREQEEHEYATKVKRAREEALLEEERQHKEKVLQEREAALRAQEQDTQKMRQQIEDMPRIIAREVSAKEQEIAKRLEAEWQSKFNFARKDWETEKQLLEITIKNLHDHTKRQEGELAQLRAETERANKKAQELAVKVIESGASRTGAAQEDRGAAIKPQYP